MKTLELMPCSQCGTLTEWDWKLGDKPLCTTCYDKVVDSWNPAADRQRRYYQEHREQVVVKVK